MAKIFIIRNDTVLAEYENKRVKINRNFSNPELLNETIFRACFCVGQKDEHKEIAEAYSNIILHRKKSGQKYAEKIELLADEMMKNYAKPKSVEHVGDDFLLLFGLLEI
jgi:hypothetical protein